MHMHNSSTVGIQCKYFSLSWKVLGNILYHRPVGKFSILLKAQPIYYCRLPSLIGLRFRLKLHSFRKINMKTHT